MEEKVDILKLPTFEISGVVKTIEQAWDDGDWIAIFHLWIVQDIPFPSIVYQQRNFDSVWVPGLFDTTAGGHYSAGEQLYDGIRESIEEVGRSYTKEQMTFLGKKIQISSDVKGRMHHNIINIFMVKDDTPISEYKLQKEEVNAICSCPVDELIKAHTVEGYTFEVDGIRNDGTNTKIKVSKDSFPYNWDNYHYKIALLSKRFLKGENNLFY